MDEYTALLKQAARESILESFVDQGSDPSRASDRDLARMFDEITAPPMSKTAAKVPTAEDVAVDDMVEKIAEMDILGRAAARSWGERYFGELEKIAQGLKGLMDKLRGQSSEEARGEQRAKTMHKIDIDRMTREHEVGMRPKELEVSRGEDEAKLRQMMMLEMQKRQEMASALRKLQLSDQYSRREREEEIYDRLHHKGSGPSLLGGAARGGLVGGIGGALMGKGRGLAGIGALAGAGLAGGERMLNALKGPSRSVERMEKERMLPGSMQADVLP